MHSDKRYLYRFLRVIIPAMGLSVLSAQGGQQPQTITFPAISDQVVTNTVGLYATASSELPVSFAVVGSGPATISGNTNLSFTGAGQVSIKASQTGDDWFAAAPDVTNTFTVSKATQAITFPAIPDQCVTNRLTLSATAGSGLPVSFAVGSGPATVSGNVATFSNTGLVSIIASQAGNANWASAPDVTNIFMVSKATQTITFPAIPDQCVTNRLTLSATAGSGLPVSFAVGSGPATISDNVTTFSNTGLVSIIASQAGNTNWAAAPNVTNMFNVLPLGNGLLWVVFVPAEVTAAGAQWRIDGGDWQESGTIMTGLTAGTHTVNFSGVTYYVTPANQVVTISQNQITVVQGAYNYVGAFGSNFFVKPICADYDGDKKADPAYFAAMTMPLLLNFKLWAKGVYPSTCNYQSSTYASGQFGAEYNPGDYTPIAADFDGDGKPDLGFYKAATGKWSAMLSTNGYAISDMTPLLGNLFCTGLAADFDGDHKADPTVYNPVTADWEIKLSSSDYQTVTFLNLLGGPGFAAGAADMDGDGFADFYACNMKTGQCKVLLSRLFYARYETEAGYLGTPGGILALADYDGDGFADPTVCLATAAPTQMILIMRLSGSYYTQSIFSFIGGTVTE